VCSSDLPGEVTGSGSPADPTGSGPAGTAGMSHRSDVAALRQWINHPERRNELPLPDLTADHHGTGFQKAVAAYQAATATVDPAPVTAPVVDPAPVTGSGSVTDPAPSTNTPIVDPAPTPEPPPVLTDPAPAAVDTQTVLDATPVVQPDPRLDPALLPDTGSAAAI